MRRGIGAYQGKIKDLMRLIDSGQDWRFACENEKREMNTAAKLSSRS